MPLDEEGAKWSCEPCIRGHRSSKCQHFDRLMMKVPKAGRPLAKCPHPKGSCSCQKLYAFMIRIPKGSTCLCRPVYHVPADSNESPPATTPTYPASTPSPASGKIQKPGKRQVKAAPENLAKALDAIPEFSGQNGANGTSTQLPAYNLQTPAVSSPHDALNPAFGTMSPLVPHGQTFSIGESSTPKSTGGSCCSQEPQPATQVTPKSSCCQKSESSTNAESGSNSIPGSYATPLDQASYTPTHTPRVSSWQDFQAVKQGPYLPPYSMAHRQHSFVPHVPQGPSSGFQAYGMGFSHLPGSQVPLVDGENSPHAKGGHCHSENAHDCQCGDNCQCLGCASHPYNNTTRQHVQQMGLLVAFDGENQNFGMMNGYPSTTLPGAPLNPTPMEYPYAHFSHQFRGETQPMTMPSYEGHAGASVDLNNGYSSTNHASDQQFMEPSEYYTLEYPVGLPPACSDMTGSCQCGNDCSCVGCLTHSGHNGVSIEPIEPENHTLGAEKSTTSPADETGITSPVSQKSDHASIPSSTSML